ncbi:MAG: hypothetical protein HWD82_06525 [Flavobacteriaceae bacterium]|nr:hypothetical protein [Flavobacteriaceae bacterium]
MLPLLPAPIIPTRTLSIFGAFKPNTLPLADLFNKLFVFSTVSSLHEMVELKPRKRAAFDVIDKKSFLFIINWF